MTEPPSIDYEEKIVALLSSFYIEPEIIERTRRDVNTSKDVFDALSILRELYVRKANAERRQNPLMRVH
jgi:hypothetical protein